LILFVSYLTLPARSSEWQVTTVPLWKPLEDPERLEIPQPKIIQTPLKLEKTDCPVKPSNRDKVTEQQRRYAAKAPVATGAEDLESKVSFMF
jgi:hypothetical protein